MDWRWVKCQNYFSWSALLLGNSTNAIGKLVRLKIDLELGGPKFSQQDMWRTALSKIAKKKKTKKKHQQKNKQTNKNPGILHEISNESHESTSVEVMEKSTQRQLHKLGYYNNRNAQWQKQQLEIKETKRENRLQYCRGKIHCMDAGKKERSYILRRNEHIGQT